MLRLIFRIVFGCFRLARRAIFGPRYRAFTTCAWAIDGDTLGIPEDNGRAYRRIRLAGIDAPEMSQPGGAEAKARLSARVRNRTLTIAPETIDRYGRYVARVRDESGRDLGQDMVRDGFALAARRFDSRYLRDMRAARRTLSGLWATGGISDPAAWRRSRAGW